MGAFSPSGCGDDARESVRPMNTSPSLPGDDVARFALVQQALSSPLLGDILDSLGSTHQILPSRVRPIDPSMSVVGRAMPVLIADVFGPQQAPFGRLTYALDDLMPGEVYLARGGRLDCAAWGELLTVTARRRGAAGAVLDAFHRDTPQVLDQGWPVFSKGAYARDAAVRASVIDYRVPIEIDGVAVVPGDLIVGDVDGVVVVPRHLEDEVLERALVKAATESSVRAAIEQGMSATEAFATFGVL